MQDVLQTTKDLAGTIALLAMLSVAYGAVRRWLPAPWLARIALGALFGAAAALAMFDPIPLAPGVIADMRNLPVALAGAFLGWPGALVAAAIAAAARIGIGGAGAPLAVLSILVATGAGLWWASWAEARGARGPRAVAALAALSAAAFLVPLAAGPLGLAPPGLWRPFAMQALPLILPLHVAGMIVVGSLLARERRLLDDERRLLRAATIDPLTGLLNRRGFEDALARLPPGPAGLLVLDLDHFKRVNDERGHEGGDAVLRALPARLSAAVGAGPPVARLGGEEVAVQLPGADAASTAAAGRRLRAAVAAEAFALPGGGLAVTASVGGAWTAAASAATLPDLVARADGALYAAKRAGRDRFRMGEDAGDARAPARAA